MNTSQLLHFKNLFDPWASWDSGQQINPCSDRPRRCFNMSWHSLRFTERPWCSCWAIQLFQKPDQNVVLFWWFWNQSEVTLLIFLLAIWNETFRVCKYEVSTIIDEQTLRELQGKLDTLDKFQVTIWRDLVYDPPIQRKCSSNWTTTSVVIECPWNPLPSNCIAGATGRIWPVFTSVFLIETGIGKVIIEKWIWFKSTRLLVTIYLQHPSTCCDVLTKYLRPSTCPIFHEGAFSYLHLDSSRSNPWYFSSFEQPGDRPNSNSRADLLMAELKILSVDY